MKNTMRYLVAVVVVALVAMGSAVAQDSDVKIGRNMEVLMDAFRDLNMFYVDDVDSDRMLEDAIQGMTRRLDPYTEFLPEKDMEQFEVLTTGKYGGIGSIIRQKEDWVYIAQPYKGFPADKAGLQIGDKILAVDGQNAQTIGSSKVSSMLKGDPGTTVRVTLEKFYTGKTETAVIERERISISGVPYYGFVSDSIGYISHNDFTENCSDDMRNAIMRLKQSGRLKGLILDYRGNGGGILQEAVKILSMFVPKGTEVVSMRGRTQGSTKVFKTETDPIDLTIPIVVLTSAGSASAAEIVAGALQDLDRAVLVGQRTFGKGLVQSTRLLGYNSYIKITTAKYYMPSGRCIQAIDYAHRDEDQAVESALDALDVLDVHDVHDVLDVLDAPDSLVKEFTTSNGRKVYDGGGIMPDVKIAPIYISRFSMITYAKGYTDDFAELYAKKYRTPVDIKTFKLTDADYAWFAEFMEDKDVEYRSETAEALKMLKEKAKEELYLDSIKEDVESIEKSLKDDKSSNLQLYRSQISNLIEDNIIMRYHYNQGVIEHNLVTDDQVIEGVKLLNDTSQYNSIITSNDTSWE